MRSGTDCGVSFEHLDGSSTDCVYVSVYSVCVCGGGSGHHALTHRLVTQQRLIMAELKGGRIDSLVRACADRKTAVDLHND